MPHAITMRRSSAPNIGGEGSIGTMDAARGSIKITSKIFVNKEREETRKARAEAVKAAQYCNATTTPVWPDTSGRRHQSFWLAMIDQMFTFGYVKIAIENCHLY